MRVPPELVVWRTPLEEPTMSVVYLPKARSERQRGGALPASSASFRPPFSAACASLMPCLPAALLPGCLRRSATPCSSSTGGSRCAAPPGPSPPSSHHPPPRHQPSFSLHQPARRPPPPCARAAAHRLSQPALSAERFPEAELLFEDLSDEALPSRFYATATTRELDGTVGDLHHQILDLERAIAVDLKRRAAELAPQLSAAARCCRCCGSALDLLSTCCLLRRACCTVGASVRNAAGAASL